ncbi:VOC family protein [Kutzneria albida]|uniref:Glyoxalase-like domain-containing protein n=1 Tax=Kutzneria albida DSM 43870 TaxID=1449976 RepID=W5WAX4_9PSEU|nr:VOC family protein [Kutzneria albida]AHH97915.1 hypothetical protein KALB_4553 [Kutzneria albida DSM 43870]
MATTIAAVTIDCAHPETLAEFWSAVLALRVTDSGINSDGTRYVEIGPSGTERGHRDTLLFEQIADGAPKTAKNRLHIDLDPGGADPAAEVRRVIALGARRVAVGQSGEEPWTVLADPEGNEFCVLHRDPDPAREVENPSC